MKMNKIAGIVTAAWILAASTQADVITNYYDDFSGTGALNNTTPDTGTGLWSAHAKFGADGSTYTDASANGSALLAFIPEAGKVYTLSVDVSSLAGGGANDWVGVGFATSDMGIGHGLNQDGKGVAAVQLRQSNSAFSLYGSTTVVEHKNYGTIATLKLVLTTHADSTPWTVDYFADTTSLGSYTWAAAGDPGITQVAMTAAGRTLTANVDDFTMTVVPEPATIGMLGLGALITLAIRRKLRA